MIPSLFIAVSWEASTVSGRVAGFGLGISLGGLGRSTGGAGLAAADGGVGAADAGAAELLSLGEACGLGGVGLAGGVTSSFLFSAGLVTDGCGGLTDATEAVEAGSSCFARGVGFGCV